MEWVSALLAVDPSDPLPAQTSSDHFTIIVTLIGSVLVALIGAGVTITSLLLSNRRKTEEVNYAVTNDHEKPLRDDMDGKHDEMVQFLNTIVRMYKNMDAKVDRTIEKIDTLVGRVNDIEEDTFNPRKDKRND